MKYLIRKWAYALVMFGYRMKRRDVIFEFGAKTRPDTVFEGMNKLSHHAYFSGELGFASYIGADSIVSGKVGRFCSIAEDVIFLTKTHPIRNFVSTHPAFYSLKKQSGFTYVTEQMFDEVPVCTGSKYSIEVGNDVYIGYGATIVGPCRIGDGAVIAAGAVVTGDVPAYAIAGGVPAKIIKYRFSEEEMNFLKELRWWDKSQEWLKEHAKEFGSVEQLRASLDKGGSIWQESL